MITSTAAGTLKFDDVNNILINEELRHKSIAETEGGEAIALVDHGRIIGQGQQGCSRSRGRSKSRRDKLIFIHFGKPGHKKKER